MADSVSRREVIAGTASLVTLAGTNVTAATNDVSPRPDRVLKRIAFGSCAHQEKEQPVWDAVLAAKPDLFVFLGDNIYADTRDISVIRAKYAQLATKPGFKRLRETVPIVAVWDDHDFGENDAGQEYPLKEQSKRAFLEFWGEAAGSSRWTRDGVYTAYVFGPPGQRVQIILPDLRSNRTLLRELELGGKDYETWAREKAQADLPVPGPYERNPDPTATMLGETQWRWLEEQLQVPADVRLFGSSLQVLADFPGWEAWINYAHDHQRLIETIRRTKCDGMIFLSGDTHYAEVSRLDVNAPYPLWDLTSSGITEVWPVLPPNANRVGDAYRDVNFGIIDINWDEPAPLLSLQIRDVKGETRITQDIKLSDLRTA